LTTQPSAWLKNACPLTACHWACLASAARTQASMASGPADTIEADLAPVDVAISTPELSPLTTVLDPCVSRFRCQLEILHRRIAGKQRTNAPTRRSSPRAEEPLATLGSCGLAMALIRSMAAGDGRYAPT